MWPLKKVKLRRLEVRRQIKPTEPGLWQRFRESRGGVPLALVVVFFLGTAIMDMRPVDPLLYRQGQFVPSDIYARIDFKTYPQRLLEEARSETERTTPGVFSLDTGMLDALTETLATAPAVLSDPPPADNETAQATFEAFGSPDEAQQQVWGMFLTEPANADYEAQIGRLIEKLSNLVVVDSDEISEQLRRSIDVDIDFPDGRKRLTSGPALISTSAAAAVANRVEGVTEGFAPAIQIGIRTYLVAQLTQRPLYVFDAAATQREVEQAIAELDAFPPAKDYERGQRLVTATTPMDGRMVGLSDADLEVLREEHKAYMDAQRQSRPWWVWGRMIGRLTLLGAVIVVGCIYVVFYRRRVVTNPFRALAIVGLFLSMLAINKVMFNAGWDRHVAVLPVMIAAVILTIAYNQRFALAMGAILSMLVVLQMRSELGMLLVITSACMSAVLLLDEVRTRSKLIEVSGFAGCVTFVIACAVGMMGGEPWPFVLVGAVWAGGFALLVGFIVQGFLPLIERSFNIATSMTLLEWCDASKPLLRRLAMNAPGTYNHALQLGTMCEAAAESIGANGLLARVGAYYHDIGKTNKPEYFVENHAEAAHKHEKLSPEMSLLILFGHVKDGIEMAREYNLPKVLHEFIDTHHGTTVAQFFYHAATQKRRENEPEPDETQFRYPGPRPHSKEAGILMIADAAESSVRAMTDPTTKQIETQVHRIVTSRLADGQLDECELTLTEVHRIEQSLVKSLLGFYHARIAYPKMDHDEQTPSHGNPGKAGPGASATPAGK
jgi:putative nucleotidyltransferase with HDIG domain